MAVSAELYGPPLGSASGTTISSGANSVTVDASRTTVAGPLAIDATASLSAVALQVAGDPNTGIGQINGADTLGIVGGGQQLAKFSNGSVGVLDMFEPGSTTKLLKIQVSVGASGERTAGTFVAMSGTGMDLNIGPDINGTVARTLKLIYFTDQFRSALEIANTATATLGSLLLMKSGGDVVIGGSVATNATKGFPFIPSCAGTPTGVPAGYSAGTSVALAWDRTNKKLYVYDGSWLGGTTPGAFT